MLTVGLYHTFKAVKSSVSFVEYAERQAEFGPVGMSIHDQAHNVVRGIESEQEFEVIVFASLATQTLVVPRFDRSAPRSMPPMQLGTVMAIV